MNKSIIFDIIFKIFKFVSDFEKKNIVFNRLS